MMTVTGNGHPISMTRRTIPERIYTPNIAHNPFKWMGVWTPQGWRVHRKRFGQAVRKTIYLSGDGRRTFFPHALRDPDTNRVEWQDDLHLEDDPYTDAGIFPCDPRVEYPPGSPRWRVSHTLLAEMVADHNLYTHEYTWDLNHGHLYTSFRRHVALEKARTDSHDGRTVRVRHTPISTTIEGNISYPLNNSAVRGVWGSPERSSPNLYARRVIQLLRMHNGVYVKAPYTPVVQCHGLFPIRLDEQADHLFDSDTGLCLDVNRLEAELLIPVSRPRLGMIDLKHSLHQVKSRIYDAEVWQLSETVRAIAPTDIQQIRKHSGSRFLPGACGYAFEPTRDQSHGGYRGYNAAFDMNADGVIDEEDARLAGEHLGREVRYNLYQRAYFGGDWLSSSVALNPELMPGDLVVADYEYGAGYDSQSGTIQLHESPGPDQPVWVEYHYDAPAEHGRDNIVVHIYEETD